MADARLARQAVQVAGTGDADARLAREAVQVAAAGDADARVARSAVFVVWEDTGLVLIASSSGSSTASASLTVDASADLEGASSASTAVSGFLPAVPTGSSVGSTAVAAGLTVAEGPINLGGSSQGTTSVSGDLSLILSLTGLSSGLTTPTSSLTNSPPVEARLARQALFVAGTASADAQLARFSVMAVWNAAIDLEGHSSAGTDVSGSLTVETGNVNVLSGSSQGSTTPGNPQLFIIKRLSSVGRTAITAILQVGADRNLEGPSTGSTTVTGYLDPAPTVTWPLPYPLGIPGGTVNLYGASEGSTTVGEFGGSPAQLSVEISNSSSSGSTTTTGALSVTNPYSGSSSGSTTVSGEIFNTGDVDLSGSSQGSTRVSAWKFNASPRSTTVALYFYVNIGIGFDPTDTYTGPGNLVDQVFPDGDVDLFPRSLYWTINVGVGFDPTDDVLTRGAPYETIGEYISQVFPDGNVIDFTRALYQYLDVIALDEPDGWVTVGPTPETIPPRWKASPPKWTRRP